MDSNSNDYSFIKQKHAESLERESNLTKELNLINQSQTKLVNEMAIIEAKTQKIMEEINIAKKEESSINEEKLQKMCKSTIDFFLKEISLNDSNESSLSIRIEYQQMKIFKSLVDDNMTFEKLKEETKLQFGKEVDEFYFADSQGNIFLDDLKVITALFPLSIVKVDKYEPVIQVIDKASLKKKKNKDFFNEETCEIKKKPKANLWKSYTDVILSNYLWPVTNLIIFLIFLALYIKSCFLFLNAGNYRSFKNSIDYQIQYLNITNTNDFNENFSTSLDNFFSKDLPNDILFSNFNKWMGDLQIMLKIQKDEHECDTPFADNCKSRFHELKTKSIIIKTVEYPYTKWKCYSKINSFYDDYSCDGFSVNVKQNDPNFDVPIQLNNDFISLTWLINLYNINAKDAFLLRIIYERTDTIQSDFLNMNYKISYINWNNNVDGYLIGSILLSFVLLVWFLLILRKPKITSLIANDSGDVFSLQRVSFIGKMQQMFRFPTFMEFVFLINVLFYYGLIIFRFTFDANINSIAKTEGFINFYDVYYRNELVVSLICFNIWIFFMVLLSWLNTYWEEFQIITISIKKYLYEWLPFIWCVVFPFILISMYVAYFMFGGHWELTYKNLSFVFLKVWQSISRGSLSDNDYNSEESNGAKAFLSSTINKYLNLNSYTTFGYLIYSLTYFLFCFAFVKCCIVAYFFITYRNVYLRIEEEKVELERKKILEERLKGKVDDRKVESEGMNKVGKLGDGVNTMANITQTPLDIEMVRIKA